MGPSARGLPPLAHVEAAVALVPTLATDAASLHLFDETLADLALRATVGQFRAAARRLATRLGARSAEDRHAAAFSERRVVVEPADDGMAWISAYVSVVDAHAIERRLTSTAKHVQRDARDGRSRDQVRADLFTGWLRGVGTPTAVKTKVFVTVPVTLLGDKARASVRRTGGATGTDLNDGARLVGDDDLDQTTAIRLLLEQGSFTRVITDPVSGIVLDMDRRARKVTRAQREWLILTHGTCTRDGCARHAADADIDHWRAFWGPGGGAGGPTNLGNLHPFCASDHKLKHASRVRYRRRLDHTVQAVFPTGYRTLQILKPPPDPDEVPF